MLSQVFISYKREEIEFAELLESKLKEANFNVWIDRQLRAGTDWREKIDERIRKSIALIVIMTPAAKESEYVTYEWAFAYGAGVRVIPLIFKSVKLHPRLEALHYRDFSNEAHQPWDELISDLRDAQASQLTIHYAVWGAKNKMDNVTHKVREKVSAGKLDIRVSREILGESAYGDPKKLMVIYSYRGKVNSEEADEDGRLILPR
jgi:hypothetical protein